MCEIVYLQIFINYSEIYVKKFFFFFLKRERERERERLKKLVHTLKYFFFEIESQPMTLIFYDNSLSLDQDTNRFLV